MHANDIVLNENIIACYSIHIHVIFYALFTA